MAYLGNLGHEVGCGHDGAWGHKVGHGGVDGYGTQQIFFKKICSEPMVEVSMLGVGQ